MARRPKGNYEAYINYVSYCCTTWNKKKDKTFNKRKNRALLTLRRSQKHYEIFSNNVLRKTLPGNNLKDGYLKPSLDTLWCVHKVNTDYRPKYWKYWLG